MGGARERTAGKGSAEPKAAEQAANTTSTNSDAGPAEVLRRILDAVGWVDRTAVEVQAEELGLPWRSVRREIDRLIEHGRIATRTPPGEAERIAWIAGPEPEGA